MQLSFDQGTLLLTDLQPTEALPGVRWDARVNAHRAPAVEYGPLRDELAARAVAVVDDRVRARVVAPGAWAPIDLRPYQEASLVAWQLAGRRGVVVLPTGSGKTRLALAAMARSGLATLCLAPTRVLVEQWLREIQAVYDGPVGCFGDGTREVAPITVATFESAYRYMDRIGDRFELLVVDEVHHFGAGVRDEALEMSIASARLGLTATPQRSHEGALARLVGPIVYELAIGDLAGRFLASYDVVTLKLGLTPEERREYEACMALFQRALMRFREIAPSSGWDEFVQHAMRSDVGRQAIGAWRQSKRLLANTAAKRDALDALLARHPEGRILIFTADNDSAYEIARSHLIMPITCDIGTEERKDVLQRFRRGELRALVSARVLNEGIDVPDADIGIVMGSALGEREHVQRIGQLLRPATGKRALMYELVTRASSEVKQAERRRRGLAARVSSQL